MGIKRSTSIFVASGLTSSKSRISKNSHLLRTNLQRQFSSKSPKHQTLMSRAFSDSPEAPKYRSFDSKKNGSKRGPQTLLDVEPSTAAGKSATAAHRRTRNHMNQNSSQEFKSGSVVNMMSATAKHRTERMSNAAAPSRTSAINPSTITLIENSTPQEQQHLDLGTKKPATPLNGEDDVGCAASIDNKNSMPETKSMVFPAAAALTLGGATLYFYMF